MPQDRDPARSERSPRAPGDSLILRLDSLAAGGEAVGRADTLAVFVQHGAPGDLAQVRVTQVARNYARANIERLIEPGPDRVRPPCPYFPACGGCQWQHLDYPAQVRAKEHLLRQAFARIGGVEPEACAPAIAMATPWRYRAAAEYSVAPSNPPALGFLRARSAEVIPVDDCLVQHPLNVAILRAANQWLAEHGAGALWLLRARSSLAEQRALVTLVLRQQDAAAQALAEHLQRAEPRIAGVFAVIARDRRQHHRRLSHHIAGEQFIFEQVGAYRYRLGADTFFQVNPAQAVHLIALVQEMAQVQSNEAVVDAYCGAGTFLLPLAQPARQAVGVEANPAAVRDARANLRYARLDHAAVLHEKVERALPLIARRGSHPGLAAPVRPQVVVLDPPRQGCGGRVIEAVAALAPRAVVLVSCDPATLARDAALLAARSYAIRRTVPLDMFPHTWQVESVTLCER